MSALEKLRQLEEAQRPKPPPSHGARNGGIVGGIVAVLTALLVKGKVALFFLLTKMKVLFAAAKIGPFFTTLYTMGLSAWIYAGYYGWPFALGLVILILIHELGHGLAATRVGVPVSAPVFIPFFGAVISLRGKPRSTVDEAIIAAGGPIVGAVAAAACVGLSFVVAGEHLSGLLRVVGYYALVLNMFNLTPVWQLDGARMLAPVGPRTMLAGAAVTLAILIFVGLRVDHANPIAVFAVGALAVRGIWRLVRERRARPAATALEKLAELERAQRAIPDDVSSEARRVAAVTYFVALIGLIVVTHALHALLPAPGS